MRLATIGLLAIAATALSDVSSARAFETQSGGSSVLSVGSRHDSQAALGAPLYAGPNVIVIGGGAYYGQPRSYGRRGYGRHHYRPYTQRGYGYSYGYQWRGPRYGYPRYGYSPYRNNPYSYGNRYPYPRYGAVVPRPGRRYSDGYRPYARERYDRGPRLIILGATYRSIDGRACDAYSFVHRRCDGENSCSVRSSNKICGDPDRGRLKVLEVVYACGNEQRRANVPERSRSRLSCP